MTALDKNHSHAPIEVRARRLQHLIAAARIELERYTRAFLGGGSARVGELVAGHNNVPLQEHRAAVAHFVELRAKRRASAGSGLDGIVLHVLHAKLKGRNLTQDVLYFS